MKVLPSSSRHTHLTFKERQRSGNSYICPVLGGHSKDTGSDFGGCVDVALILVTRHFDSVRGIPSTHGSSLPPGGVEGRFCGKGCLLVLETAVLCRDDGSAT